MNLDLENKTGALLRKEKPELTVDELIRLVEEWDRMAGIGVTKVTIPQKDVGPILVEVSNPSVKGTQGAAKAFLFSWWAGILTSLLGKNFECKNVVYDQGNNIMKCEIVQRETA